MELIAKKGYKQTEVGLIPEDWEVSSLDQVIKIIGGGTFKSGDRVLYGIRWLKIANVGIKQIKWNDIDYLPSTFIQDYKMYVLNKDDVVMALTRPILSGNLKISKLKKEDVPSLLNQRVGKIETLNGNSLNWIYHLLQSNSSVNGLLDSMAGTDPPNLSNRGIYNIKIPLPPTLSEQQAIATALSDVDAIISNLEQRITKKKAIKQGAMQQLLTPPHLGGKRLDGFSGEWEEKSLNQVCWFQEGPGLRNWQFTSKGMKVINITNLVNGYLDLDKTRRHISLEEFNKMYKHFEIDENDIVVASSGNSYCKTAVVRKKDLPLVMNTSVIRFKPSNELSYKMLLIFLKSKIFKNNIDLLITGGAQPNFGPAHLNKIKISLPPTITEQNQIAQILSDMDTELETLESQKAKCQELKQGMMQELLTGKTRLV